MSSHLPSLDLLRVFEACARLLSFTAAAAELGTTQPAISQQVQRLEKQLATRLFDRVYRGIELTGPGLVLLDHVQDALESLRAGFEAVSAQAPREVIAVATDFAFAAYWLMPRLPRFYQRNPHLDVSLVTTNRALGVLPGDVDAAIVFGEGRLKRGESRQLFQEEVFPVCSPRLLESRGWQAGHGMEGLPLLQLKPAPGQRWFDWPGVFHAYGLPPPPAPVAPGFDNYTLVIGAALAGQGVAIGWRHLVDDLVGQGLLCPVLEGSVASPYGYHLVLPQRKRRVRVVQRFVDWMDFELGSQ